MTAVDDYIAALPAEAQPVLQRIRNIIHAGAPGAVESIRYQMPTVFVDGHYLVYFAAWKHHIGLYPIPTLDEALEAEVTPYRAPKDSLRFPYRQPIPYDLFARLVAALVAAQAAAKH